MKNVLVLMTLLLTSMYGCKKDTQAWADYNNAVVKEVKSADSTIQQLFTFKDFESFPEAMPNYHNALNRIKTNLESLQAPGNDDSLRLTALYLTDEYMSIAMDDFKGIYTLMHDSIYTPQDSMRVGPLSDIMYSKWQIASEKFATTQKAFGKKYNISLE